VFFFINTQIYSVAGLAIAQRLIQLPKIHKISGDKTGAMVRLNYQWSCKTIG
jgi:hypothetical protein